MHAPTASRLILGAYSEEKTTAVARELLAEVGGKVTCALVFASANYRPVLPEFLELIQVHGHVPVLAGCSGSGLIGAGVEAEGATGFSLIFLHLPETEVRVLSFGENAEKWEKTLREAAKGEPWAGWLLLGNPATLPVEDWLRAWSRVLPGVPCLGGLASGVGDHESFFVVREREVVESAVALGFRGGVRFETVVSQGCRPIGEPFTITGAEQNIIQSLGSRPAYERLAETVNALPKGDQSHASGNLFAGIAMSEYVDEFKTGNFLVRNLLGADPASGALALGALPRVGQTLQFQLRDRESASEELHRLLSRAVRRRETPLASLVFSCTGRGRGLFGTAHHDARAVTEHLGPHPSAGFFCNGEIGPVGGENFVHGYTASIALVMKA